jgi:excisionase family DNA binding protein
VTVTHGQECNSSDIYRTDPHLRTAYTIPRAAELCSISRSQIYVEIQKCCLPAIKIGGRTLILHDDLIAWLKSRPRKQAAREFTCRSESER